MMRDLRRSKELSQHERSGKTPPVQQCNVSKQIPEGIWNSGVRVEPSSQFDSFASSHTMSPHELQGSSFVTSRGAEATAAAAAAAAVAAAATLPIRSARIDASISKALQRAEELERRMKQ